MGTPVYEDFLYDIRPRDESGSTDLYWVPQVCEMPTQSVAMEETVIVMRRRVCRCPKCRPDLVNLYQTPSGQPNPGGARTNQPGQQGDPWADAPTEIELQRVEILHGTLFKPNANQAGIRFPIQFTEVKKPKVITVTGMQPFLDVLFGRREFEDFVQYYRFRTDHPDVHVAFFWADKKVAGVEQRSQKFLIKLALTFSENFRPGVDDTVRLILERRLDQAGNYHDIACLEKAIVFGDLSEYPALQRYFGEPEWKVADVGLFIEPENNLAVFRLPKKTRDEWAAWLSKPIVDGVELGVNSRETALVMGMLLLWYLDEEYGETIDEFLAKPIEFIKEKVESDRIESFKEELLAEKKWQRTAYGAVLRKMDPETRKQWSTSRRLSTRMYKRASAVLEILEKIEFGLRIVMETIRISQFVESVLRKDTIYTTKEEYIFISFLLDPNTKVPNGVVGTNLIPIDFGDTWYVLTEAIKNQFYFWESANAYYLSTLDIDKHVRNYCKIIAEGEEEGKDVCFICGQEYTGVFGTTECDSTCTVCGQKYHRQCMAFEFGAAECQRCLQRDVVETD